MQTLNLNSHAQLDQHLKINLIVLTSHAAMMEMAYKTELYS